MRLKLIACKVMFREISRLAADCPNVVDITWMRQGFHDTPDLLRSHVQDQIDRIDEGTDPFSGIKGDGDFDAILLGYGLCSNGIAGLTSKKYPIVIPRGHDCITFFLGSKERYRKLFDSMSGGIYWYSAGWCENVLMPGRKRMEAAYAIYLDKYGEENAEYLMETEQKWFGEYKAAVYIGQDPEGIPDYANETREAAEYLGWAYWNEPADLGLLRDFLYGKWDEARFLVVPPESTVDPSYGDDIIKVRAKS